MVPITTETKKVVDSKLKRALQDCTVDEETQVLQPKSALSIIKRHIVNAAFDFDKKEYHPYDMRNPDFL